MTDKKISQLTNISSADLADSDEFVIARASTSENFALTKAELYGSLPPVSLPYGDLIANTKYTYTTGSAYSVVAEDVIATTDGGFWEVAASGASDHHATTAGGVKLYEAGPNFSTRARAVAWWARMVAASKSVADGTVISFPVGTGEKVATLVAQFGETDVPGFSGWTPADERVSSDVFAVPRDGSTDATSAIAAFLLWQITTGRQVYFERGTYLIDGQGADTDAVTITVPSGYKDVLVDASLASFVVGSSGNKLDGNAIRYAVTAGLVTADFQDRPRLHWQCGFWNGENQYNSTSIPFSGLGETDVGSSTACTLLRFDCRDDTGNKSSFRQSTIENGMFWTGDHWETTGGDEHITAFGLGQATARNLIFIGARDQGLYGGGSVEETWTTENLYARNCMGAWTVKQNGKNVTHLNGTAIDCVFGPSTQASAVTGLEDGALRVIMLGLRTARCQVPFRVDGGAHLTTANHNHTDIGYAHTVAWDNGVSSAAEGERISNLGNYDGIVMQGVVGGHVEFYANGINPNITSGSTTARGFSINDQDINSVDTETDDLVIRATILNLTDLGNIESGAAPDNLNIEIVASGHTNGVTNLDRATNWRCKIYDMDTHSTTESYSGENQPVTDWSRVLASASTGLLEQQRWYGGTDGDVRYVQVDVEQRSDGSAWLTFATRDTGGTVNEDLEIRGGDRIACNREVFANSGLRVVGSLRMDGTVCPDTTFTTVDGKTITITNGVVTGVA